MAGPTVAVNTNEAGATLSRSNSHLTRLKHLVAGFARVTMSRCRTESEQAFDLTRQEFTNRLTNGRNSPVITHRFVHLFVTSSHWRFWRNPGFHGVQAGHTPP